MFIGQGRHACAVHIIIRYGNATTLPFSIMK